MKVDIEKALRKALKTGKVYLGSKRTLKALRRGEAKMVIVAMNCPKEVREKISKLNKSNVPVLVYDGTNMELGAICGKPFSVAALAIIEAGESEILSVE
jgi:large subunit ribosomal protein L30e